MSEQEALNAVNKMMNNFKSEKAQKKFRKWTKTMSFEFTDLEKTFYVNVDKGTPGEAIEGVPDKSNVKITTDSVTWTSIMNGEISGMKAYTAKKLKVKGSMPDLLKLQKLMK